MQCQNCQPAASYLESVCVTDKNSKKLVWKVITTAFFFAILKESTKFTEIKRFSFFSMCVCEREARVCLLNDSVTFLQRGGRKRVGKKFSNGVSNYASCCNM